MNGGSLAEMDTETLTAIIAAVKSKPTGAGDQKDKKLVEQLSKELQSREGQFSAIEIAKNIIAAAMKAGVSVETFNKDVQKSLGELLARR